MIKNIDSPPTFRQTAETADKQNTTPPDTSQETVQSHIEEETAEPQLMEYLKNADNLILQTPEMPKDKKTLLKEKLTAKLTPEEMAELENTYKETDILTGLPNRKDQNSYITRAIFDTIRGSTREASENEINERCKTVALFNIDVNDLKIVNDAGNHEAGNMFLHRISNTLQNATQEISSLIGIEYQVARDGGDEFSICIKGNVDLNQTLETSNEIIKKLSKNEFAAEIIKKNPNAQLVEIINEFINKKCATQNHNDLFLEGNERVVYKEALKNNPETANVIAKKIMQEKIFKAKPEKGYPPADLNFMSYVSMKGSTLADIRNTPDLKNFKNFHEDKTVHDAQDALQIYMGALRKHTDTMAIENKRLQKEQMRASRSEADRYRANIGRDGKIDKQINEIIESAAIQTPSMAKKLKTKLEKLLNYIGY